MTRTTWITGANGFTGQFMVQHLKSVDPSARVIGIDIRASSNSSADESLVVDLCDGTAVKHAISVVPPDVVIHLAGLMPPADAQKMKRVNVDASVTLARSVLESKLGNTRIVCAGSAAEYGSGTENPSEESVCNPAGQYGQSKHQQTTQMLSFNSVPLEIVIARPFNLIGPGLSENLVAGGLCRQFTELGEGESRIIPKGPVESVRDFIDVRDVAAAYWTLAMSGEPGQIYNVCTGKGTSISQLIEIMQLEFGVNPEVRPDYDNSAVSADRSIGQNQKLQMLGWRPTYSIEESVAAMVAAARKH